MTQESPSSSNSTSDTAGNPLLIGVNLSGNQIYSGLVKSDGQLVSLNQESYLTSSGVPERGAALVTRIRAAIERARTVTSPAAEIGAIGVGLPGLVNQITHHMVSATNVPGLADIDWQQELGRDIGIPFYLDNNANMSAYAEMICGVARGVSDWIYLSIGTGIGSGLVLDGKLRRGTSGYAGEVGHINIDPDGDECACGSFGCLETKVSAPNIVRRTQERLRRDATSSLSDFAEEELTYDHIIEAAQAGDDLAILMMQRTGHFIGLAVADLINVLNLSLVVIGGKPAARPFLVPAIIEEARRRAFAPAFADCRIVAGLLGPEAGVIGAALLAAKSQAQN